MAPCDFEVGVIKQEGTGLLSLTELEVDRLFSINSRSTCVSFSYMREMPSTQDLLDMSHSYPPQCVVVGPRQQLWCCMVFPTIYEREMAEKELDGCRYKGGEVRVDRSKKLVPIAEGELEMSRQWSCLAVHGVSPSTTVRDLQEAFPASVRITIASRGGSAFLQYKHMMEAEREFRLADRKSVRGHRVVVMFSHSLARPRHTGVKDDLRGKLRRNPGTDYTNCGERKSRTDLKRSRSSLRSRSRSSQMDRKRKYQLQKPDNVLEIRAVKKERQSVSSDCGDCDEYEQLYRVLVTQLVGVGLPANMARDRASDICSLWDQTGYSVEQLREVMNRVQGRADQRRELCRIVKEKCRREAKKMNIDISAMVDITVAFLLETEEEELQYKSCVTTLSSLVKYLLSELIGLGMKRSSAKKEVAKVVKILLDLNLSMRRLEAEFTMIVGDTQSGGLTEFHKILEGKLTGGSLHCKYLSPRLAAGLVMEFFQGMERVKTKVDRSKGIFKEVDKALDVVNEMFDSAQVQKSVESTPAGFPRMGAVLAYRLSGEIGQSQRKGVKLARSMVAVWVNFGFDYNELDSVYKQEKMTGNLKSDQVSLIGLRKLLHAQLRAKIDQGFSKPKDFSFSKLIDLTIFYFENAV